MLLMLGHTHPRVVDDVSPLARPLLYQRWPMMPYLASSPRDPPLPQFLLPPPPSSLPRQGSTPFCIEHGGGKRCQSEDCTKAALGATRFCIKHGGGKRCGVEGCSKSALGSTSFCKLHGGGRKCKAPGCKKLARSRTAMCQEHGGGRRCLTKGCVRRRAPGAEVEP